MTNYILNGHEAVEEPDVMKWALWFEGAGRIVAQTNYGEDIRVSTVFLGIDHSFNGGEPLLFETMVFGGELDEEQDRCSTWEEAEIMHELMCEKVKSSVNDL